MWSVASQLPWPLQQLCTEQSVPLKPAKHKQPPSIQRPWPQPADGGRLTDEWERWFGGNAERCPFCWLVWAKDGEDFSLLVMEKWQKCRVFWFILRCPKVFSYKGVYCCAVCTLSSFRTLPPKILTLQGQIIWKFIFPKTNNRSTWQEAPRPKPHLNHPPICQVPIILVLKKGIRPTHVFKTQLIYMKQIESSLFLEKMQTCLLILLELQPKTCPQPLQPSQDTATGVGTKRFTAWTTVTSIAATWVQVMCQPSTMNDKWSMCNHIIHHHSLSIIINNIIHHPSSIIHHPSSIIHHPLSIIPHASPQKNVLVHLTSFRLKLHLAANSPSCHLTDLRLRCSPHSGKWLHPPTIDHS